MVRIICRIRVAGIGALLLLTGFSSRPSAVNGVPIPHHSLDHPATSPSNSYLPNVRVPAPPPQYNFSAEDHGGLIDAIGSWHVFFAGASTHDPQTLETEVTSLMDYYQQAMANDGWILRERTPVHYSKGSGYPPESRFGVEAWFIGNQAVWMEIESWAPWQGRGWQLNMLFRFADTRLATPTRI